MDMWHVFICGVYSGAESVRQKIWTHIYNGKDKVCPNDGNKSTILWNYKK